MSVSGYLWVELGIFLAVLVILTVYSAKKTQSIHDFAISSSQLGPYTLGLSFAATFFSAATFMGYPGWSYAWGYSNLWLFLSLIGAAPLGIIAIGKIVRKVNTAQKSLSLPDWLGDYYQSSFLRVGSGIIMLFNIFYIAAQFTAGAQIFQRLLGFSYLGGLITIAAIVVAYVFVGGTFADVYTDAVQAIIMAITGVFVFISGIMIFGDGSINSAFRNVSNNLKQQDGNLIKVLNPESGNYYAVYAIVGIFVIQFAFSAQPQLFNKVLSLKRERDLGKMLATYIVTAFLCLLVIFGGFYARADTPGLDDPDISLLNYVTGTLPAVLAALVAVVILAAALSTTDGLFVVMSTVFANDVYRKYLAARVFRQTDQEKIDETALTISRYSVLVVGVLACLLVLQPPDFLGNLMWTGISGVSAGTLGPVLYAVFVRKSTSPRVADISMVAGFLSYIIIFFGGLETAPMVAGAWSTLIGIVVMFSLATMWRTVETRRVNSE